MAIGQKLNALAAYDSGYVIGRKQLENQQRDQELQRQQAERQRLQALQTQVGGMAASGDYRGAQQTALQGGQFDVASKIGEMDDQQRQWSLEVADLGYRIAEKLKTLPEASRGQAFANAAPVLVQNYGIKPEQLPKDFSDASLDNLMRGYNLLREQAKPTIINTRDGPVTLDEQGNAKLAYEVQNRAAPSGYQYDDNGQLVAIPGGPADPNVIRNNATTRRQVVTSNPMPRAGGRSGGGGSKLPPGFILD